MKNICLFAVFSLIVLVGGCSGCGTKAKALSEIVAKVWTAQTVKEASTLVYTKGATTNLKAGYSNFRLDLSSPTSVSYREFDGNTFTGTWSVLEGATGNKLTLSNLNPKPTGTDGTIEFTINSAGDTQLDITRTTSSQKTGGTINNYNLTNQ
jgi:hypothetical protein